MNIAYTQLLIEKIQSLPLDRIAEINDFVDFLHAREQERALVRRATQVSAPNFAATWNNKADEAYDAL